MNIYALQTARQGSKSVFDKSITIIKNKPCYQYNVDYTKTSLYIKDVFISTNIPKILKNKNYNIIKRPDKLCKDNSSHYETILHGLKFIEKKINEKVDVLVILLGNSVGAYTNDLDKAINKLLLDKNADSIISIGRYNMFNPFRAYCKKGDMLDTLLNQKFIKNNQKKKNINDRNAAGDIYFFNGSFWIIKRETLMKNNGLLPFPWLGKKILYYEQPEELMEIDALWQLRILQNVK